MSAQGDELRAAAAEQVLGLLAEGDSFHQQLADCENLRTGAGEAAELLVMAAESLPAMPPPPRVKARFLESIGAPVRTPPQLGAVLAHEGKWRASDTPGITFKKLYSDKVSGLVTTLVRMEPGASLPAHQHGHVEQCLILEGDLIHDDHVYGPGDFTWAEAGSIDPAIHTKKGNLLLIIGGREAKKVPS